MDRYEVCARCYEYTPKDEAHLVDEGTFGPEYECDDCYYGTTPGRGWSAYTPKTERTRA